MKRVTIGESTENLANATSAATLNKTMNQTSLTYLIRNDSAGVLMIDESKIDPLAGNSLLYQLCQSFQTSAIRKIDHKR